MKSNDSHLLGRQISQNYGSIFAVFRSLKALLNCFTSDIAGKKCTCPSKSSTRKGTDTKVNMINKLFNSSYHLPGYS